MSRRKAAGPTIRAVAQRAGVSAMTVSNVINSAGHVSPATAEVVRAAIEELGYRPNIAARRLANARATMVGLMYSNRRTPFLEAILVGALRATNARGLQLVLHEGDATDATDVAAAASSLVRSGVDALLLVPPYAEIISGAGLIATLGIPAAAIATGQPLPDIATVRIDNRGAMAEMTRLVVARGHRRIAFVAGPASNSDSIERLHGFRDALAEAGVADDPALHVAGHFDYDSGVSAARQLLRQPSPPSAIVCSNDEMAAGVVAEALRSGLRLPDDLAVTGFDDTLVAARMWPPLTVIRQPVELMAFTAIEQLVATLSAGTAVVPVDRVVAHVLVERQSLGHAQASGRK
jgi:LacI family transcriptional regulator